MFKIKEKYLTKKYFVGFASITVLLVFFGIHSKYQ